MTGDPPVANDQNAAGPYDPDIPSSRFRNRELSWLDFNSRVLAQAEDVDLPLLERLKFCAIYSSNLDEFYMVRVAGLKDQVAGGVTDTPPDGLTPIEQIERIRLITEQQSHRLEQVHVDELPSLLADNGIHLVGWDDLGESEIVAATQEFEDQLFPVLTPLAVDPGHPFPYISTLSLNLAVAMTDPDTGRRRFARVKVPPAISRFMQLPTGRYVPIEQVIAAHLELLFPGMDIVGAWPFRVTRNADLALDDEDADDLLEAVELELRRRRFGRAIRLEIDHTMPADTLQLLLRELDLDDEDVFRLRGLLDCTGYWQLVGLDRPELQQASFRGRTPAALQNLSSSEDFFARLRDGDVLLHHPYDSFRGTVGEFVRQASVDPKVLAIKLTLYRTSGDSPIVESLIRAAEQGKQVAALVELKARFDERANIGWARRLEEAGVHVAYGLVGLKIHCKTTLVVRSEPDGLRRYCHIGTGNYNPHTARIYEDLGVLSADPDVGDDLTQLFNYLTGYGRNVEYERLAVAPRSLRTRLAELIAGEADAGPGVGRIVIKMNSLVDAALIDDLYAASQAGVDIDLIVRGICCLRPGIPGLSENIRVRSLVGRYLEHSRVFYFANGQGPGRPTYLIGSADLMPRNLDRRVEVLLRVEGEEPAERLDELIELNLADDTLSWELGTDGVYRRIGTRTLSAHDRFEELARERAEPTADETDEAPVAAEGPPAEVGIPANLVRASGCVVWRRNEQGRAEVLVVHRPRYDDWSFPKGKLDPGESDLDCAVREVQEETGVTGEIGVELTPVTYLDHRDRPKLVRYWLMEATGGSFVPNDEVDVVRWAVPEVAAGVLTYDRDRAVLDEFRVVMTH